MSLKIIKDHKEYQKIPSRMKQFEQCVNLESN